MGFIVAGFIAFFRKRIDGHYGMDYTGAVMFWPVICFVALCLFVSYMINSFFEKIEDIGNKH